MNRLAYVSNINIPDDWGHSIQVMNMSNAFALNNIEVTLFVPDRDMPIKTDPFVYYGIRKSFKIKKLFCLDFSVGSKSTFLYYLRLFSFHLSSFFYFLFHDFDLVYSRDDYIPFFIKDVILEKHAFPKKINFFQKIAFRRAKKIVVLTSFLKNKFINIGISPDDILVSSDAVDVDLFDKSSSLDRSNFGFGPSDFILGYVGALRTMGMDKGLGGLFEVLKVLPLGFKCLIVGGWGEDIEYYKKLSKELGIKEKVFFTGKVPHGEVARYMKVCDVLMAPFPNNEHFSFYMSPLKIFEYMASKKPIITTDLPSLREILTNGENALLVPPSNPKALMEAVMTLKENAEYSNKIAEKAYSGVLAKYTWKIRAGKILSFISK